MEKSGNQTPYQRQVNRERNREELFYGIGMPIGFIGGVAGGVIAIDEIEREHNSAQDKIIALKKENDAIHLISSKHRVEGGREQLVTNQQKIESLTVRYPDKLSENAEAGISASLALVGVALSILAAKAINKVIGSIETHRLRSEIQAN